MEQLPDERIAGKIFLLRGEKVILDLHLAELYGVETRVLKQAVRRNIQRFPEDFMFILSESEVELLVSQNVIPGKKVTGGSAPFAFTESGTAMLSSVLRNQRAVDMNILIVRTFVALRRMALNYRDLLERLEGLENRCDHNFAELYTALKMLLNPEESARTPIGFDYMQTGGEKDQRDPNMALPMRTRVEPSSAAR